MKLTVNYDLINRIKESKKGFCLSKTIKYNLRITLPLTFAIMLITKDALKGLEQFIFSNLVCNFIDFLLVSKETNMQNATYDLRLLAGSLNSLDVRTSMSLLQDSKVIQNNYEIKYRDDKLPILIEKKYITVPLCNGYYETILQEHIIGNDNYELSVKEPTKKLKYKPIRSMG